MLWLGPGVAQQRMVHRRMVSPKLAQQGSRLVRLKSVKVRNDNVADLKCSEAIDRLLEVFVHELLASVMRPAGGFIRCSIGTVAKKSMKLPEIKRGFVLTMLLRRIRQA